jgi:hypothetical protein
MPSEITTPQQQTHLLVKGSKLLMPDLYGILPGWRCDLSKDCSPRVHDALESWMLRFATIGGCMSDTKKFES